VKLNHKHYSLIDKALSRRSFLAGAGGVAAAGMLAGCSNDGVTMTPGGGNGGGSTYTDADVLNFALNLEYLEASFYLYAATGSGLASADMAAGSASPYQTVGKVTTSSATVTAQKVVGTTTAEQQIINEIAAEEQNHVRFLRAALSTSACAMPNIDLTFFTPLATLATAGSPTASAGAAFSPFTSFQAFLIGSFIFEDVGVTAYAGGAPLISASGVASGYLNAAAGILAVEAYHAAYVRTALTAMAVTGAANATTYLTIANQVEALRATLTVGNAAAPSATNNTGNTGVAGTSATVEVPLTAPASASLPTSIVPCDATHAIGFARSVNQVHHIVYGNAAVGTKSGGFFPNGTNSIFATTTA
jgi:hypothetical protein